ncbi:MAG: tRNA lysidine(34) synthetase TilS [Eubacteriales bacterium]|nr:tRNA lysidine(34) synthetase TilS [Eubacteriales bacterium]
MKIGFRQLMEEASLAACGITASDRVLVALSGGADSTALLLSMKEWLASGGIGGLFAAHLNHGIRAEDAMRDQRFCERLCGELGVPLAVESCSVPAFAKEKGISIELAARELRYNFLERARQSFGADVIATAHHKDDQAETVLLHLLRGAGVGGLGGMKPRNGRIVRPLLPIGREEILAYLAERGASYCEDKTNAENDATRNRIRNELVPLLRTYNPNITEALCRTAALCAADDALLTELADEAEKKITLSAGLDRTKLGDLPEPLKSRVVRKRILALDGNVSEADIARVTALLTAQTGTKIELAGRYCAWVNAETLMIGTYPQVANYETPFVFDGETRTPRGVLISERVQEWRKPKSGEEAFLSIDALPKDLVVRSRREGDRFFPLGAPGSRKLSDVFTDRKIPLEQRDLPLLCAGNEVFYAAGLTISEKARVTAKTREILHITFNRG